MYLCKIPIKSCVTKIDLDIFSICVRFKFLGAKDTRWMPLGIFETADFGPHIICLLTGQP